MTNPKRVRRFAVRVTEDLYEQLTRVAAGAPLSPTITSALPLLIVADALVRGGRR